MDHISFFFYWLEGKYILKWTELQSSKNKQQNYNKQIHSRLQEPKLSPKLRAEESKHKTEIIDHILEKFFVIFHLIGHIIEYNQDHVILR